MVMENMECRKLDFAWTGHNKICKHKNEEK